MQVTKHKVLLNCKFSYNKRKWNTGLYKIRLIIVKEIIPMVMTGPCEMSSPSPKFLSACSKFPDVPLFRPNLFIG